MAATTQEFISALNHLIQSSKDGQEGYRHAAVATTDPTLRSLFAEYASQRERFAGELQQHVTGLGANAETGGSVAGAVHRGWLSVKEAVTGHNDHSILEECERGEDGAVKAYRDALALDLPADIRAVVQAQASQIHAAHDRIRTLRDSGTVRTV